MFEGCGFIAEGPVRCLIRTRHDGLLLGFEMTDRRRYVVSLLERAAADVTLDRAGYSSFMPEPERSPAP